MIFSPASAVSLGLLLATILAANALAAPVCHPGFSPPCPATEDRQPVAVTHTHVTVLDCVHASRTLTLEVGAALPLRIFPGETRDQACQRLYESVPVEVIWE